MATVCSPDHNQRYYNGFPGGKKTAGPTSSVALSLIDEILANYRSLECSKCCKHIAFQLRLDPKVLLCSTKCLSSANEDSHELCSVGETPATTQKSVPKTNRQDSRQDVVLTNGNVKILKRRADEGPKLPSCPSGISDDTRNPPHTAKSESDSGTNQVANPKSFAAIASSSTSKQSVTASNDVVVSSSHADANASKGLSVRNPFNNNAESHSKFKVREKKSKTEDSPKDDSIPNKDGEKKNEKPHPLEPGIVFRQQHKQQRREPDEFPPLDQANGSQFPKLEELVEKSRRNSASSASTGSKSHPLEPRANWKDRKGSNDRRNRKSKRNSHDDGSSIEFNWRNSEPSTSQRFQQRNRGNGQIRPWSIQDVKRSSSLKNGTPCTVALFWSPTHMMLQASKDLHSIRVLEQAIFRHCQSAPPVNRIPAEGELILAPYLDQFYRARVNCVSKATKEVSVSFIDVGDELTVGITDCCEISEALVKNHPVYAVEFTVTGLSVERPIPESAFIKLNEAVQKEELILEVESEDDDVWTGSLRFNTSEKTWDALLQELLPPENEEENFPADTAAASDAAASDAAETTTESLETPLSPQLFLKDMKRSSSVKHGEVVHINFMWNYKKLTVVAENDLSKLSELANAIEKHVECAKPMARIPLPNEVVLAPYHDGVYYRVVVKDMTEDQLACSGEFIDYGDARTVSLAELRNLNAEICEHPLYGLTWMMPDIPEEVNKLKIDELNGISEDGGVGQIEVENMSEDGWSGQLWISKDKTWNEIAKNALESPEKPVAGTY